MRTDLVLFSGDGKFTELSAINRDESLFNLNSCFFSDAGKALLMFTAFTLSSIIICKGAITMIKAFPFIHFVSDNQAKQTAQQEIHALEEKLKAREAQSAMLAQKEAIIAERLQEQEDKIRRNNAILQARGRKTVLTPDASTLPPILPLESLLDSLDSNTSESHNAREIEQETVAIEDKTEAVSSALSAWLSYFPSPSSAISFWRKESTIEETRGDYSSQNALR